MQNKFGSSRYDAVAIVLHWIMAIAFICMLGSGIVLEEWASMQPELKFMMYQWHKSLGVILIIAFLVRLVWRLSHKPPHLPQSFKKIDVIGAKLGHLGLYIVMIAMPLSGWLMVSSSVYGLPTIVFGWFEWPHIPYVQGNKIIYGFAKQSHEILSILFMILIGVHVLAVVKHMIIDKENILKRMLFTKNKGTVK